MFRRGLGIPFRKPAAVLIVNGINKNSRNPQGGHVEFDCRIYVKVPHGIKAIRNGLIVGMRSVVTKFILSYRGQ